MFKFFSKIFHVTGKIHGEHFFVKENGKHYITPLFFALITIETMDVIFALDSIPAIFLITQDVFIVYTSNIFAILGLSEQAGDVLRTIDKLDKIGADKVRELLTDTCGVTGENADEILRFIACPVDHSHLYRFEDFCAESPRF